MPIERLKKNNIIYNPFAFTFLIISHIRFKDYYDLPIFYLCPVYHVSNDLHLLVIEYSVGLQKYISCLAQCLPKNAANHVLSCILKRIVKP